MQGATEYAQLFKTGQYGRLYLSSGTHARGTTFHIYVLPEGEEARWNGDGNGPRNSDAVEVYGIVAGQPGWTESYGWLEKGPWQEDFLALVEARKAELAIQKKESDKNQKEKEFEETMRKKKLLESY